VLVSVNRFLTRNVRVQAWIVALVCLLRVGLVQAQQEAPDPKEAADGLPGSPRPPGVGLSPEAPPTPPAPGGRAPSFGAPTDPNAWVFRLGGRFSAWWQVGIGRSPEGPSSSYEGGPALHTPPRVVGRSPMYAGTAATLNFQYGNQLVMAFASYEASLVGAEWEGHYRAKNGPRVRSAYVTVSPPPLGAMRLRFQVGAFPAHYGAPGPWGWGMFGPVLAIHGYGGIAALDYDLPGEKTLSLEYGISGVSEVPEDFVRGTFTEWPENGISSIVNHAHAGISFKNKYFAKLHYAYADGRNFRRYLDDDEDTAVVEHNPDGRMHVAALELRAIQDPFGELGITPVFWDFKNARSVHDGIWWGLDWTAGGREMSNKFLGPDRNDGTGYGTGRIFAVSSEYDFSVSRMLSHPEPFDGNGQDLRVVLAFIPHWTLSTDRPEYAGASGYFFGATFEHVLLSWLSTTYRVFGESRDSLVTDIEANPVRGRFSSYSASLGFALHTDWQSRDRVELFYSRYFYSDFTDNNPQLPLDKEAFTLGASLAF
jgi:hypothetical protein